MPANGLPNKAIEHKDEIIQRLSNGERLRAIAQDLGYQSHSTISGTFRDDPSYKQAVSDSALAKLEMREEQMESATEQTDLVRARELLSHARWWAERVNREQFSPKPDIAIQINNIGGLEQALTGDAASLLDKLRTVAVQQQTGDIPADVARQQIEDNDK